MSCHAGTFFNPATTLCEVSSSVCGGQLAIDTTYAGGCKKDDCVVNGEYAHPTTCSSYCSCHIDGTGNGALYEMQCPYGLYYYPPEKQCTYTNDHCTDGQGGGGSAGTTDYCSTVLCTKWWPYESHEDCTKYCVCSALGGYDAYEQACASGTYYNELLGYCDTSNEVC
ncbi:peritrophin-1-like [Lingula anatina]|uniref:Peritrophin-1-like n=1 Tax=Lingula anatina TaxID=7574 RepID=A0A1S3HKB4_LINAN|nr:peritrophin-1-like [Lingula anatina]|eukprot:XP_013386555.1 peritrophin-1-like [Lingula anatina]